MLLILQACNGLESNRDMERKETPFSFDTSSVYFAPDTSQIPTEGVYGQQIRYGRDLVVNTAYYLGPDGVVGHFLGNKLNCQSCHLEAGTKPYGLNLLSTHGRYPQYRARENRVLTLGERINNCIERPMNGKPLPLNSKEIIAIACYIKWLGETIPTGMHVKGDEGLSIPYPERPANPIKGALVYKTNCAKCHGLNGEGQWRYDSVCYTYPPLWGPDSYQPGSSIHRIVKAAKFIYANMPNENGTSWLSPKLTVDEAFDVAAFINDDRIHNRPKNTGGINYPDLKYKPIDYGTGPFLDTFSEIQHKFGPFQPIINYRKKKNLPIPF